MTRTLLVSIRPRFAELIFAGVKTVELRRTRPNVRTGDGLAIYVPAPTQQLQGIATITGLAEETPLKLWSQLGHRSGLKRDEFMRYFDGANRAFGIVLSTINRLPFPRSLQQLRIDIPGFSPPQIYRYLTACEISLLNLMPADHRAAA